MNLTEWFIVACITSILLAVGVKFYDEYSSEKIEIRNDEFVCTEYKQVTKYRTTLAGKVPVTTPYSVDECINYKKIK